MPRDSCVKGGVLDPCFEARAEQIVMLADYDYEPDCFYNEQTVDLSGLDLASLHQEVDCNDHRETLDHWEAEQLAKYLNESGVRSVEEARKAVSMWFRIRCWENIIDEYQRYGLYQ